MKRIKRNQIYIKIKHNSIDIKTKQWYSTSEKIFEIPYWWYWFKILMSNLKIYIRNMVNFLQIFLCMILQFTDRLRKQTRRRKNILSFFKFPKGGFWKLFSLFFFFLLSFFSHSLTSLLNFLIQPPGEPWQSQTTYCLRWSRQLFQERPQRTCLSRMRWTALPRTISKDVFV